MKKTLTIALIALLAGTASLRAQQVSVEEGVLTLPTYIVAAPETAPIFDCDWSYQRARRSVYPYALDDNMTREKKDVDYKALYLENEYIKVCILPEIGGRLFYAIDKTNGYDIFYHQDVVKPANVGMLGQWISGGVEWNVFHHHRNTTALPCNYELSHNPDGSCTVWIGETEWRHRMAWTLGLTLRPGKSYIEVTGRLMNSTMNDNSFLFWANVATKVDEKYQIIFPQCTEFGIFHSKESVAHWPYSTEPYNGTEAYADGVYLDMWGAHPVGNSIFIHDQQDDFVAGYDHGAKAGTIIVGNHNIMKGGKFWSWGPNSGWDTKILTENAGHYIELMAGVYSDNQPDYNWNTPYETKTFTQYMFGIRDMGGVKKATEKVQINMEILDGHNNASKMCGINGDPKGNAGLPAVKASKSQKRILLGVNATEKIESATIEVTGPAGQIFSTVATVSPADPFVKVIAAKGNFKESDLTMTVKSSDGNVLLSYTPVVIDATKPLPDIVKAPVKPHAIENTEECYLVGLRALQFHNPFLNPLDYFYEVLRRDPGDIRTNTKLGAYFREKGFNDKAAGYLRTAIRRQTKDYTRPQDAEAIYNLGLILKDEGEWAAALDTLYRATWIYNYNSAANVQLAQIYVRFGKIAEAAERLEEAIDYNGRNVEALNLMTSVQRMLGNNACAEALNKKVAKFDPLNLYAAHEAYLLGKSASKYLPHMAGDVEAYIELAIKYFNNGIIDEAEAILRDVDASVAYPKVKMWLGHIALAKGGDAEAHSWYEAALELPVEGCNPFRNETLKVLKEMQAMFPDNYKTAYYLGNIYYDRDPSIAVCWWKRCIELNPSFALAWRNLGWEAWKYSRDFAKAVEYYRKAIELDPSHPLFFEECDQAAEAGRLSVEDRYELLKSHHAVCEKRYYPLAAEVITGTFCGDYDYVLNLLRTCYFPTREGVANFHDVYVDALMMAGYAKMSEGLYAEAIELFKEGFEFPETHQVFYVDTRRPRDSQIYHAIASAYEKMGDKAKAQENYRKAAAVVTLKTDYRYWQALSLDKLGRHEEAKAIFEAVLNSGKNAVVKDFVNFFGAEGNSGWTDDMLNTLAYYSQGLGYLGLGDRENAAEMFSKALSLKPDHLWARTMLNSIK